MSAIEQNYRAVRAGLPDGCRVMAVVKADAYGHGAEFVAPALQRAGADAFAVSNIEEGIALRKCGITAPVLILGCTPVEQADRLLEYDIATAGTSLEYCRRLSRAAEGLCGRAKVHIKLETGMGRLGIFLHDERCEAAAVEEIKGICALGGINVEGAFTHFSTADEPDCAMTERQFRLFTSALSKAEAEGCKIPLRHCCNSAGSMRFTQYALEMCRPGIVLYGVSPDNRVADGLFNAFDFHPAMTLKSCIAQKMRYPAQSTVSYGAYRLPRESDIAVIPVGYADGFPRRLSGRGKVLVGGRPAPIVGRICMDMTMIDVTGLNANVGDEVTLFGPGFPVEAVASDADTIGYELLCTIGHRVARKYYENGRLVGIKGILDC